MGRPSIYHPELIDAICARLSTGEPLAQICREESMPSYSAVYAWQQERADVKEAIARARDSGEDFIADDCLEIADNATNDWMEKHNSKGESIGWELNGEHVQRSKLRIETRLKLLAKWNPKKYGDSTLLKHSDPDGNALHITVTGIRPTEDNT